MYIYTYTLLYIHTYTQGGVLYFIGIVNIKKKRRKYTEKLTCVL